jgi:hypothetical protein
MKEHVFRVLNGLAIIRIVEVGPGVYACPICGYACGGEMPWFESSQCAEDGTSCAFASVNICPCCNVEYGYDDPTLADALLLDLQLGGECPRRRESRPQRRAECGVPAGGAKKLPRFYRL